MTKQQSSDRGDFPRLYAMAREDLGMHIRNASPLHLHPGMGEVYAGSTIRDILKVGGTPEGSGVTLTATLPFTSGNGLARLLLACNRGLSDEGTSLLREWEECEALCIRKNADYGWAFAEFGAVGVAVRLHDKFLRIQSLKKGAGTIQASESILDTWRDAVNYIVLAWICLKYLDK